MNKDRKPITVIDQLKSETCIIAPDRTGPIVDPKLSPQLISPVIIPYVCTLSLGCPLTLGKKTWPCLTVRRVSKKASIFQCHGT